jgi:hypothetical protein
MLGIPLEFYMNFDPPDIGTERFPMPFLLVSLAFDQSESLQCFDIGKYIRSQDGCATWPNDPLGWHGLPACARLVNRLLESS